MNDFPIQGQWSRRSHKWIKDTTVPLGMVLSHEKQALENHCGQTLKRLSERGGLSACEMLAVLEDRKWHAIETDEAFEKLREMVKLYEKTQSQTAH